MLILLRFISLFIYSVFAYYQSSKPSPDSSQHLRTPAGALAYAALAAGIGITAYTPLVGASPSVVWAAIMGGQVLFPHQVGRVLPCANAQPLAKLVGEYFLFTLPA